MADLNHVALIGRLTRDAELKYTAGGQAVCKFSIAVNRRRKNGDQWEDEANYFDIVLWGRQGESLNQYLVKGKQIGVDGELRQDRWQQDGQNRSKVEIVADNVQLLGGGQGGQAGQGGASYGPSGGYAGNGGGGFQERRGEAPPEQPPRDGASRAADDGFTDDIPF
ncbi:MAG: single-stranded DNA-binding protein [Spirochaetaceae bacterium]|jgi:single-strand DNA-binding protein|nr:single-stranded DNA-binding protein [Spirochaetaceae bacterium]